MQLLRYGPVGQEKPGLMEESGAIRDLSGKVSDIAGDALSDAGLDALRALDVNALPVVESAPRIGACVGQVGKFICIGQNYADHAAEFGMTLPEEPVIFFQGNVGDHGS